jgi:excisionase family DNA binding protein
MSEEFERKAISVRELNKITGISGSTIRKWLKDGDLKGIKAGKRRWLIPISELQRMIKT